MKKHDTKITSKSIEQSGLPSDYKKAISEYIWNGFDAGASTIKIDFSGNEIGYLNNLTISDNGKGIKFSNLEETFGHFLDSNKTSSYNTDGFIKGKKGKGRYSFSLFCNSAIWETTVQERSEKLIEYKIRIQKSSQHQYNTFDNKTSASVSSGTIVHLLDFFDLSLDHLTTSDFTDYLAGEFGWFLYLNLESDFKILINGKPLEYETIIEDSETFNSTIENNHFNISFRHLYTLDNCAKVHID